MVVRMCNPAIRWEGLSTDARPTVGAITPIQVGWMLYETDTYLHYMWTGVAWVGPVYWLEYIYPWDEYAYDY